MMPAPVRYLIKSFTILPFLISRQITKLIPRSEKKVCIGAWFGNLYSDNPKYFAEYLLQNSDYELTWIGNDSAKCQLSNNPRLHFARKGSFKAIISLLRAKFWICCIYCTHDLTPLPLDGGVVRINLWHGIPIKKLGKNSIWNKDNQSSRGLRPAIERAYCRIVSGGKDWFPISSADMVRVMEGGAPEKFSLSHALPFGTPRNDFLIKNDANLQFKFDLKKKYSRLIGFDPMKKIVLYLPTFRKDVKKTFCFYDCDASQQSIIANVLDKHNAVLIEKHHFHTYEEKKIPEDATCSIPISAVCLPSVDVQELLLIADVLICDYSSAYLDFSLLKRPIIHYVYDYGEYTRNDSDLAYDINEVGGGEVVQSFEDLTSALSTSLGGGVFAPKSRLPKLVEYEKGTACEQLLAFMGKSARR